MRVCGKNVFNETDKSKIKKVYLSSNFKDQEIIQTIKKSNCYQTIKVLLLKYMTMYMEP